MKTFDVLIIGAGSVGVPLAYFLAKAGSRVAVIEKHHSVGRGENKSAIGGVRATHSDPAKIALCRRSLEIIRRLKPEFGHDVDYMEGGYLFPVYDEKTETTLKNLLRIQKEAALNIDWVKPEGVQRLAPGISRTDLRGGTFSPEDGHLSPLKLAGAFYRMAMDAGVTFCFEESVKKFVIRNRRVVSVLTDKSEYSADVIVNASGGFARTIGELAGIDLPVFPDSHEAGITEPVQRFFDCMVVDIRASETSDNYYFYQNQESQVVFCITPRPKLPGRDTASTSAFLPMVVPRMLELYPRLRHLKVRRTWRGLYPMTPDGRPIVGFTREIDGFFQLVGMCGQGLMIGPGLGEIAAEIIANGSRAHDAILSDLSLYRRFGGTELLK